MPKLFFSEYYQALKEAQDKLRNIPSQIFTSTYGDIEYYLVGDGLTILMSHGITGGVDQGMGLSSNYIGGNYRFLYISRFGYLKSGLPQKATSRLQAEVYKELIDYLGIKQVFIFGNSAGGPSAMYFARDYPQQCLGLILLSSAVPGATPAYPPDVIFKSDFVYWLTTKLLAKYLMRIFTPTSLLDHMTKSEVQKIASQVFLGSLPISKRTGGVVFDNKVSNPSVDIVPLEQIKTPTLVIHAVDDPAPPITGAREIARKIENSRLVTFTGGHLILGHETEIKQEIEKFVRQYNP